MVADGVFDLGHRFGGQAPEAFVQSPLVQCPDLFRDDHWTASFELQVPRTIQLRLNANNGWVPAASVPVVRTRTRTGSLMHSSVLVAPFI